jgi:hypothetical protein
MHSYQHQELIKIRRKLQILFMGDIAVGAAFNITFLVFDMCPFDNVLYFFIV